MKLPLICIFLYATTASPIEFKDSARTKFAGPLCGLVRFSKVQIGQRCTPGSEECKIELGLGGETESLLHFGPLSDLKADQQGFEYTNKCSRIDLTGPAAFKIPVIGQPVLGVTLPAGCTIRFKILIQGRPGVTSATCICSAKLCSPVQQPIVSPSGPDSNAIRDH